MQSILIAKSFSLNICWIEAEYVKEFNGRNRSFRAVLRAFLFKIDRVSSGKRPHIKWSSNPCAVKHFSRLPSSKPVGETRVPQVGSRRARYSAQEIKISHFRRKYYLETRKKYVNPIVPAISYGLTHPITRT
jgi:hypothetical protein